MPRKSKKDKGLKYSEDRDRKACFLDWGSNAVTPPRPKSIYPENIRIARLKAILAGENPDLVSQ